jgi:glutamate-1-semialdehyde 2,1-aminomutase
MSESKTSAQIFAEAERLMPGGVSSPVRAFRAVGGTPRVTQSGSGTRVRDVEGREYLDFLASWGPLILGHAHPDVVEEVTAAVRRGTTFGALCPDEVELAREVVALYPGIEQVRFVSSGTEATMSAIRLARGATRRDVVVKFSGCYHGHADHLLVAAGSGLATFGNPSSAGVPEAFAEKTLVLPLDDEERLEQAFRERGPEIAAVILEPIPANNGLLIQRKEWLDKLRALTEKHGALLIFDEVITGFRVAPGGAAERLGITPDIATFGKVIGGGLPVGAFAARRELMHRLSPDGPIYQAGTLAGNPVAMAAGLATLRVLQREDAWRRLEALGEGIEQRVAPVLERGALPASFARVGSIFWMCFQDGDPPRTAEAITSESAQRYGRVFHGLLERGINVAPSAYEVGFVSLMHSEQELDRFSEALAGAIEDAAPR